MPLADVIGYTLMVAVVALLLSALGLSLWLIVDILRQSRGHA